MLLCFAGGMHRSAFLLCRLPYLLPAGCPACLQVRTGALATAEGISYLEAKHLLLLNYCMCIVFYLLLKAEGRPVREHPVIVRLVELRAYLEKIRPIDRKLQYQMDKLLLAAKSLQVGLMQSLLLCNGLPAPALPGSRPFCWESLAC